MLNTLRLPKVEIYGLGFLARFIVAEGTEAGIFEYSRIYICRGNTMLHPKQATVMQRRHALPPMLPATSARTHETAYSILSSIALLLIPTLAP